MAFFSGKLPVVIGAGDYFDTVWRVDCVSALVRNRSLWRMKAPESTNESLVAVRGANVVDGFKSLGYITIGTGAVEWFNDRLATSAPLIGAFEHFSFRGGSREDRIASAEKQLKWVSNMLARIDSTAPVFLFINFGETHNPFCLSTDEGKDKTRTPYGDVHRCKQRQIRALLHLDGLLSHFGELHRFSQIVMCGDHGTCFGEDGLWGHNVAHQKVMEVPLLIKS